MIYFSDSRLKFFVEALLKPALYELNIAQLKGYYKSESYFQGQVDVLETLAKDLKLKIDIDKLKI